MRTDMYCMSKFQIIYLHMHVMQYKNSKWKSLIPFIANFDIRNVQLLAGKFQFPALPVFLTHDAADVMLDDDEDDDDDDLKYELL